MEICFIDFLSTSDFYLFSFFSYSRIPEDECLFCIYTIDGLYFDVSYFLFHFALKQIHFLLSELYDRGYEEKGVKVVKVFMI